MSPHDLSPDHAYVSLLQHFARYFDAVDSADFDTVLGILAGATVRAGALETADPAVIREAYASKHAAPDADGRRPTKNHVTNLIVDGPDDSGTWRAAVYYFRLEPRRGDADAIGVGTSGRIRQTLTRLGDSWRVHSHEIITDF